MPTNGTSANRTSYGYPHKLVDLIKAHGHVVKRATNSTGNSSYVEPGCVVAGTSPFVGSATRAVTGLTALLVAIAATLLL